jgi:hypothetical protein
MALATVSISCRPPRGVTVRELNDRDWIVVHRVPDGIFTMTSSADGAIFITAFSGGGAVFRSRPGHDTEWTRVVVPASGKPIFRWMYAPSATTLIGFGDGHLLRWDEGKGVTDFGPAGESKFCGDYVGGSGPAAIWGRNEHDVFAVGSNGFILHYDGVRWARMVNPVSRNTSDLCTGPSSSLLSSVGGDDHATFAAGQRLLRLRDDGQWIELTRPAGVGPDDRTTSIVSQAGALYFGGNEYVRTGTGPGQYFVPMRLFTFSDGRWEIGRRFDILRSMVGGAAQPGSAAVFWGFDNDLLIIDGSRFVPVRLTGFRQVRGAVAVGHTIYVGGLARGEDQEVVVRLR